MTVKRVKVERVERLGIRLLPKEKFSIELLAKKNGKSITSVIKDAVDLALRDRHTGLVVESSDGKTFFLPDLCWHPIESERVVNLGLHAQELMSDYQLVMWKLICEEPTYWTGDKQPDRKKISEEWKKIKLSTLKAFDEMEQPED